MSRVKVRTARLEKAEVAAIKQAFGSIVHAFDVLHPLLTGTTVGWAVFRDAAAGRSARPEDLDAIRGALRRWKATPK